ncbi:2-oxoacid:acceptor oxidoreductase family protein [Acetomicrobium sp.]|uniref:2-oxoacid:acceptor oxidoreductase family protein n=1 Tax=Acetomicrobium sp. TaxID=1872099 RepID=UPI002FC9AB4C
MALFQTAFDAYVTRLEKNGLLFVDSELVSQLTDIGAETTVYKIPATRIALDLGNKVAANMVMLGIFSGEDQYLYKRRASRSCER